MTDKPRDAALLLWRPLDVVTGGRLRDGGDLVPDVRAFTAQSARHAVKRMLRSSVPFYVEQVEEG